jgi:hypothetical protein
MKRLRPPGRSPAIGIYLLAILSWFASAQQLSWIDSAETQYAIASRSYDRGLLEKNAEFITRQTGPERKSGRALLLLGMSYWHLELYAFCVNDKASLERWGLVTIETLNEAETAKADVYLP